MRGEKHTLRIVERMRHWASAESLIAGRVKQNCGDAADAIEALVEALEWLEWNMCEGPGATRDEKLNRIRAAIAKARGDS